MKSIEELYKRALELKNKGMSDKEISTELHLSVNTVTWILGKEFLKESYGQDVKIGWRSLGVFRKANFMSIQSPEYLSTEYHMPRLYRILWIKN